MQRVRPEGEVSWIYRVKSDARFVRGWHFHPEIELTYIVTSQGRRFVGDSVENYRSGDLVLIGPNLPHTWRSEDLGRKRTPHRAVVIQFSESFLGERFFSLPELGRVERLLGMASRGIAVEGGTREAAAARMVQMSKLKPLERLLELLRVLQVIAEGGDDLRPLCRRTLIPAARGNDRRKIDAVFALVHDRYTENLAQSEVAEEVGMSTAGFSRFFRKATGGTFVDYLSDLRLSHACTLLIDTDLTVLEIAGRSGFNNLSNFNRRFVRGKGVTPRGYRKAHQRSG